MSIRTKLLFSYIAMIVIPVLLLGITVTLAANVFKQDMTSQSEDAQSHVPFAEIRDLFSGRSELASGLRFVAQHDPKLLSDPAFLASTESELAKVDAGMVIMGDKAAAPFYTSPGLSAEEVIAQIQGGSSEENGHRHIDRPGPPSGNSLDQITYTRPDGKPGSIIIVSDMEAVAHFFKRFIPTVLLALLLALVLTNGVLTFFVSRSIIKPLHALRDAAGQIREGRLDHAIHLQRKDEIGQLGSAFEEMRIRLKGSINAQLQLEQSRKELLANISHDLKTPITAIQGCVDCLREGVADTEEKRSKYIDMIGGKTTDMNRMIEELLLYSTLDIGKLPFRFETLDVAEYLRLTVDELKLDPRLSGAEIQFRNNAAATSAGQPLLVRADREKLHRAIFNIVNNSIKYMDKTPRVLMIELSGEERHSSTAAITISDNGTGISAEALPQVFDQFYRAESSRRPDAGSSGLGLAIVKQIIEEHGGTVEARSREGEGTAITLRLPAVQRVRLSSEEGEEPQ
ncbi:cell wall metabolism sensor histidine kinase WalK [Paenibacillus sp. CF384]|uniref:sensor histidine kinase n=1 Tax=Paenibacillus sp. CF384 TaxID=1884382 RepID=UPI0008980927|nr:HAMP domain-containing sensor histidine kinase [Paenibacillus sp. CF384]SDX34572.1 Signal transduction histidine kinase [Paenibacillus sp. CF384]